MNQMYGRTSGNALTVTQLNEYAHMLLESDDLLQYVFVRGEISNFKNQYASGHLFFSLKDDGGLINSVMFKSDASTLQFAPENGMKVIAHGRVSLYTKDGRYQLYVDSITPDGIGAKYLAFEQLKKRLEASGMFAKEHKRELPKYPDRIGIVTSPTGAAIKDMVNVLKRRFPMAEVIIYPAAVQGKGAAEQIAAGIDFFNSNKNADVIIIGRGGGSIEDLWEFNSEYLARTIYSCKIPIISAVGHETDFTISDYVSDVRAPTPSVAAELAAPDTYELKQQLLNYKDRFDSLIRKKIEQYRQQLYLLSQSKGMQNATYMIDNKRMMLLHLTDRLDSALTANYEKKQQRFKDSVTKLDALSPLAVMQRGYTIISDKKTGKRFLKAAEIVKGAVVNISFNDGNVSAIVINGSDNSADSENERNFK